MMSLAMFRALKVKDMWMRIVLVNVLVVIPELIAEVETVPQEIVAMVVLIRRTANAIVPRSHAITEDFRTRMTASVFVRPGIPEFDVRMLIRTSCVLVFSASMVIWMVTATVFANRDMKVRIADAKERTVV